MAEEQNPVTHGELVEIIRRLDDRISSMDRNINDRISSMDRRIDDRFEAINDRISLMDRRIDDRFEAINDRVALMDRHFNERISSMDRNMTEMRADIRMLSRFVMGFYAAILAVVGVAFTLYKLFPNP